MRVSLKTLIGAAKVAQWRASGADYHAIKSARLDRRVDQIEPIIRRYVSDDELRNIRKRGCVHSVDFPEKRDPALRTGGGNAAR
ncbi:hypothetical protein [Actibacterium sp. MT2.3-13A]|uniref:hypothetical protein n=1 Tax=Actibacterium sp. MT2.3-13A TaxID=2828332 RepID=UPI001BA82556|nr:hypothetical protein [Actibacterium sp. MT2.3-13A]